MCKCWDEKRPPLTSQSKKGEFWWGGLFCDGGLEEERGRKRERER